LSGFLTPTQASIVNRAAAEIAAEATVTGEWPNFSGGGNVSTYANILYPGVVSLVAREQDYECLKFVASLVPSGLVPLPPWQFEYLYPADCVRIRQITPPTWNANDPQPVEWSVEEHPNAGTLQKVIGCNIANAMAVYTTAVTNVSEAQWDALLQEAVVRTLASELAMAIAGRPDFSRVTLEQAGQLVAGGAGRDS
jgi:hypothetical protein